VSLPQQRTRNLELSCSHKQVLTGGRGYTKIVLSRTRRIPGNTFRGMDAERPLR